MITEKENFMRMLRGELAAFVPSPMRLFRLVVPDVGVDRAPGTGAGVDGFGVRWIQPEGQPALPDPAQDHVLDDICDWREKVSWPDLDAVDWEGAVARDFANAVPGQMVLLQLTSGPTERLHDLMGFEEAAMATVTDPEECKDYIEAFCDFRIRQFGFIKKYYDPDMIQFQDDWGTQQNLMMTPGFWREAVAPGIKRCIDACHDLGMLFDMHTCGKVDLIIDDIVEMGPDLIDSMQVVNDLDGWMERHGRKVVFMGGLDAQGVIDREDATKAEIKAEVRNRIDRYASKGNYIPMPYSTNDANMTTCLLEGAWYGYHFGGAKGGTRRFLELLRHAPKMRANAGAATGSVK